MEGEEPDETRGFTMFKCMIRVGQNQFTWGKWSDKLKTLNNYILMHMEGGLVPVLSCCLGIGNKNLKKKLS